MNKLIDILNKVGQRKDIMLAVMLLAIVFMMILPLPTALVDVLIGTNMSIAVVLLMLAIYITTPLEFSAFPAVLLITTLFRLSLSITTTRLILLQGDAGQIVYSKNVNAAPEKPMPDYVKRALREHYAAQIEAVADRFNRDLSHWLK